MNRLVLTVLFTALCGLFLGTYAQTTQDSTTDFSDYTTPVDATTHDPNTGNTATTTTTHGTMPTHDGTVTGNETLTNPPTAPGNNNNNETLTNPPTTPGNNNNNETLTNPPTTPGNNNNETLTNPAPTTENATTTAPPLTPNTTVEELETPVSRTGCGTEQLCASEPATCNPDQAGSCFFIAARRTSGRNFAFGLSGESQGYLATTLSADATGGGNNTAYICANRNGVVRFFSAFLNNGQFTLSTLNVNSVRGRIVGNRIQCTFAATVPAASRVRRASLSTKAQSFSMSVLTGPFDSNSENLGSPTPQLRTDVVNLEDPTAVVNNLVTTPSPTITTTPATTMSHAATLQQSLVQALLVAVAVLSVAML